MSVAKSSVSTEVAGKRAVFSAFVAFFVDMYDIYLPIVVLGMAMEYFQPKTIRPEDAALAASLVLTVTLVGRPLGALFFGYFSDTLGRKPITLITVGGFGICTLLIGLLPGYNTWGMTSLYLLIFLRFIDGIFLGGQYTATNVLAMEKVPKEKRGWYSGWIQAGYPVAFMVISLLTLLMLTLFPITGGVDSPYMTIGWRIPFFIGSFLSLAFLIPFWRHVGESELWKKDKVVKKRENPFKVLINDGNRFWQVFTMLSGFWFLVLSGSAGYMPWVLLNLNRVSPKTFSVVMLIIAVFLLGAYLLVGVISQWIGRRRMAVVMGVLACTVSVYFYYLLLRPEQDVVLVTIYATIITCVNMSVMGITTAYLNERFPTGGRSLGFAVGFALPCVIPSLYSFIQGWLAHFMPSNYTIIPLVILGGLLSIIGALWGPETKDADLAHAGSSSEPSAAVAVGVNQKE
jgi:MFS family permease